MPHARYRFDLRVIGMPPITVPGMPTNSPARRVAQTRAITVVDASRTQPGF
jgi:hypothetical protein